MVLPRFVRQALTGEDLTVYGDGTQTRCFAHVGDTVDALVRLLDYDDAVGSVFNVGSDAEISIIEPGATRDRADRLELRGSASSRTTRPTTTGSRSSAGAARTPPRSAS